MKFRKANNIDIAFAWVKRNKNKKFRVMCCNRHNLRFFLSQKKFRINVCSSGHNLRIFLWLSPIINFPKRNNYKSNWCFATLFFFFFCFLDKRCFVTSKSYAHKEGGRTARNSVSWNLNPSILQGTNIKLNSSHAIVHWARLVKRLQLYNSPWKRVTIIMLYHLQIFYSHPKVTGRPSLTRLRESRFVLVHNNLYMMPLDPKRLQDIEGG